MRPSLGDVARLGGALRATSVSGRRADEIRGRKPSTRCWLAVNRAAGCQMSSSLESEGEQSVTGCYEQVLPAIQRISFGSVRDQGSQV